MNKIKNLLIILIISVTAWSCADDFLDKSDTAQLSSATFWTDENDANAGLIAIYDALTPTTWKNPELACVSWASMGILADITPISYERQHHRLKPVADGVHDGTLFAIMQPWRLNYRGVVRANDFLANIDEIEFLGDDAEQVKNRMKAEARFLRSMFYYMLVELYGDVPLFEGVPTVDDAQTPRSPKADVLQLIKDDLAFAVSNLQGRGEVAPGRVTKAAAMALQVKVALYEKDWATAATISGQIMDLDQYSLLPNYADIINLDNENNEEIIFNIQHVSQNDAEPGGFYEYFYANASSASGGWSFIQPTLWFVDQFERIVENPQEGVDYVNEGGKNDDGSYKIPTEVYEYFEGRDPRMDHTIIRPGSHFIDKNDKDIIYPHQFAGPNNSQTGLHMRKYVLEGSGGPKRDSPLDIVIFRYADILLCHAEAVFMRDGNISQEVLDKTINAVRARASEMLPAYTPSTITKNDIYRERICELGFEGWTYFDMKRSGMIEINNGFEVKGIISVLGDGSAGKEASVVFNPNPVGNIRIFDPAIHYVWPIPVAERERSNFALTQNPGYPG